ncbi:MAG: YdcF family protein [Verrucomicrobiia bacterium]
MSVRSDNRRFWGVLTRRERWGLSARGWLLLGVTGGLAAWAVLVCIGPFLAVTDKVNADVLVVEGWVHPYAIHAGAEEFRSGAYQHVFVTGGPVTGTGAYTSDYMTSAHVGADQLVAAGIPAGTVEMVPSRVSGRDRTYGSAVALRDFLRKRGLPVQRINILTENFHARRTRLLFQKALGDEVQVGIISVPNPDYETSRWWHCSEGVRDVLGESVAYLYASLFFQFK